MEALCHAGMVIKGSVTGIIAVLIPAVALFLANRARLIRYRWYTVAPNIVILATYLLAALVSNWTTHEAHMAPILTFDLCLLLGLLLIFPTARFLEASRLWFLFHILTVPGTVFLWYAGSQYLSHHFF